MDLNFFINGITDLTIFIYTNYNHSSNRKCSFEKKYLSGRKIFFLPLDPKLVIFGPTKNYKKLSNFSETIVITNFGQFPIFEPIEKWTPKLLIYKTNFNTGFQKKSSKDRNS